MAKPTRCACGCENAQRVATSESASYATITLRLAGSNGGRTGNTVTRPYLGYKPLVTPSLHKIEPTFSMNRLLERFGSSSIDRGGKECGSYKKLF